ncbi:molybdenum cofactor biosynthesis protein MoaE [Sphingorhabdus arenilitoris]|uniref:Molybdopterin synthase catalytic subunit n=1 Tax=Sphingorhabdus arenilitoris TaxID=1490041 RepID=A0ABV8RHG5_9SPHN
MIQVHIQTERFDTGALLRPLHQLGGGAVASFTGIARSDHNEGRQVSAILLEHYPAMTQAALEDLATEAQARWSLLGGIIVHRVGRIIVGEEIVLTAAAAPHRAAALEACAFLIDRLKTDAPFWKKEIYSDGTAAWVKAKDSDTARADKWV